MKQDPNNAWGRWTDRFVSWGTLATVVVVALVGIALLATARRSARHEANGASTVLMSIPIDSARPSLELRKPEPTGPNGCTDRSPPTREADCRARVADTPGH